MLDTRTDFETVDEIRDLLPYLTGAERAEIFDLLARDTSMWRPLPGPQYMAYTSTADVVGFGGAAGGGKLLKLTEKIPTPVGWTTMGALRVGDFLYDMDGELCRVTALSDVNKTPELYRFVFDDGTTVDSCVDHQWLTFDSSELAALTRLDPDWRARRRERRPSRAVESSKNPNVSASITELNRLRVWATKPAPTGSVRTTRQIVATLTTPRGRRNHAVPVAGRIGGAHLDLPINPYVLGAWLGDGTSAAATITTVDVEILEAIRAAGHRVTPACKSDKITYRIFGLQTKLRSLGVLGNKHIPLQYLRASVAQRISLLQGLLDTDGTVAKSSGSVEFCNTNEDIIDGVVELVSSLGWKANKREGRATLHGKDCGPKWTIKFVASEILFRLPRKAKLQRLAERRTTRYRYIVDAFPIPSEPGRCIAVDSPSRTYLIGRSFIPTHNSDVMIGKALTQHTMSLLMRREYTQMKGIVQRMTEIMGGRDGYNGQDKIWRIPGQNRIVEFGSVPNLGDEVNFQGRPRDLLGIDEAANFLRSMVTFLMGWVRTTIQGQNTQTIMTFNPPTNAEGRWVVDYFAPWLDDNHLIPAAPGELRWFAMVDGEEVEVPASAHFMHGSELVIPTSRTFIPSRITDNPFLVNTNYVATLQAMPEPLRSQMLYGDFKAGMEDDPWQVIPTRWVKIAMNRWKERDRKPVMDSVGVDVARGGKDSSIIARRHEFWFDKLIEIQGVDTNSGPKLAGQVIANTRDGAPIHIDVIGVGASPYDFLNQARQQVIGVNCSEKCGETDKSGKLHFTNMRSYLHWNLRELLDPDANNGIAIPPDPLLEKELCALTWRVQGSTIYVESREDIIKRIGRSNDRGTALALAALNTPKHNPATVVDQSRIRRSYDPMAHHSDHAASRRAYNPLGKR